MPHCDCNKFIEKFRQFRHNLYTIIPNRRDTVMDLLDALSFNQTARSPVELSLNPLFRRDYSALYKAIEQFNFNRDCTLDTGEANHPIQEAEQIKKQQADSINLVGLHSVMVSQRIGATSSTPLGTLS